MESVNWEEISAKLPCKKKDPEEKAQRKKIWSQMDNNGNGYCSLAEIDKGIRDVLQCDELFDAKPAIMRAFQYAKDFCPGKSKYGADYVEFREFRVFLVALRQRFEYLQAFKKIDEGGDGRIDLEEFSAAKDMIEVWVGPIEDIEAEFAAIDGNGGGQILFDEFCAWSIKKNLDLEDDDDFEDEG